SAVGNGCNRLLTQEQRQTAVEQRGHSLFSRSLKRQRPRISAQNENDDADNLPRKQRPDCRGVIARSASRDEAIPTRRALGGPRLLRSTRNDDLRWRFDLSPIGPGPPNDGAGR